ncbi:hypothetical protein ACFL06_00290 [Patescibacteria group bacterium]
MAETVQSSTAPSRAHGIEALITPEGLIMLFIAGFIDVIDFLTGSLVVVDVIAILIIGSWTYFHSQQVKVTARAGGRIKKAAKWAKRLKWLRPLLLIVEVIPVVGMLPCWILLVYFELKQ